MPTKPRRSSSVKAAKLSRKKRLSRQRRTVALPLPPGGSSLLNPSHGSDAAVARSSMSMERNAVLLDGGSASPPQPNNFSIAPTQYPSDPTVPLVISGHVRIDVRSAEFLEFSAKIDLIIGLLAESNEIAGDTRDQLLAEIKAGMSILTAPYADQNLINVLLKEPLVWLAGAASTGIIGGLAYDAVQLLIHMISDAPPLPL